MKHTVGASTVFAVAAMVLVACKDDGVSVDGRPTGLYARVVDASSVPLAGVDMHYIFYTNSNPVSGIAAIQYALQTPQVVTLMVLDPFEKEVKRLVNGVQKPAGVHVVFFDSSMTNGLYTFVLQIGDSVTRTPFFIRDDDVAGLVQRPPLIRSEQNGNLFLSYATLGIGRQIALTVGGEVIHDSISVVLAKAGYRTLVERVRLDTTRSTHRVFNMVTTDSAGGGND